MKTSYLSEFEITSNHPTMNVKKDIANRCESVDQKCQKQEQFSQDNSTSGSDLDSFDSVTKKYAQYMVVSEN